MEIKNNNERYCEKCGSKLKDGDKFCERCGAEIKPLPTAFVNENPTDKKLNKKTVIVISVVFAIAVLLAVCAIILIPKMFGGNKAEQVAEATTKQAATEILTTAEPTTIEPTTATTTTEEPTTAKPTKAESSKEDNGGNSSDGRCYFNGFGFSIELPKDYTYEIDGDTVTFYEVYNHSHSETGSDGFIFSIEKTYDGTIEPGRRRLGSKDGMYFMLNTPMGFGMLEDDYADQCMVDARAEYEDVISTFRID